MIDLAAILGNFAKVYELVSLHSLLRGGGANPPGTPPKTGETGTPPPVQANVWGIGTNDETFFNLACAYAVTNLGVTLAQIGRIFSVLEEFSLAQRRVFVRIVGQGLQSVKTTIPQPPNADGKAQPPKITEEMVNKDGAQIIALLAKMTKSQIRNYLTQSGQMASAEERLVERLAMVEGLFAPDGPFNKAALKADQVLGAINRSIPEPPPVQWEEAEFALRVFHHVRPIGVVALNRAIRLGRVAKAGMVRAGNGTIRTIKKLLRRP